MKAKTSFGHGRIYKGRLPDGRGNNNAKQFIVVRDPQDIFRSGAVLGILDIQCGLHDRIFADGMAFNTKAGRLRIDRGALVYAKNRAKYFITEPHIWR